MGVQPFPVYDVAVYCRTTTFAKQKSGESFPSSHPEARVFVEAYLRAIRHRQGIANELGGKFVDEFLLVVEVFVLVRSIAVAIWWCSLPPGLPWDARSVL